MKPTGNQAVVGGGAGSALGVIVVVFLPKLADITFDATEASMLTAAFGMVFAWVIRYLPPPRRPGGLAGVLLAGILLGGCAVSNDPVGLREDGFIANDLKAAAFNLDQAIAIGALPEGDPAAACIKGVLADLGLDGSATPAQSFEPKRDGLISRGTVLYIRAQQVKKARASGFTLPQECKAIIGQIVIDVAKVAGRGVRSLIPGGNLISIIRGR